MTRDDIIRMAREVGAVIDKVYLNAAFAPEELERFANFVAAAEREACCKIVYGQCESDNVAQRTVNAIQARGEKV